MIWASTIGHPGFTMTSYAFATSTVIQRAWAETPAMPT
jgi:hypothetical protein